MADSSSRLRASSTAIAAGPGPRVPQPTPSQAATRRERLREFQTGLSEKLRRARNTPLAVNRLGIQIGTQRLLIDLADAGEILAVPDVTPVPLTKTWYRGLANVRGSLIGIVDLSLFAGGPPTSIDKESRVLAFSTDLDFAVGILVSRMLGLRSAAELTERGTDEPHDPTASGEAASPSPFLPWVRAMLVDSQDGQWQELDLAALTSDERFVDIARG